MTGESGRWVGKDQFCLISGPKIYSSQKMSTVGNDSEDCNRHSTF